MKTASDRPTDPTPARQVGQALIEHWMHEATLAEMILEDATTPEQLVAAKARLEEAEGMLALFRLGPRIER